MQARDAQPDAAGTLWRLTCSADCSVPTTSCSTRSTSRPSGTGTCGGNTPEAFQAYQLLEWLTDALSCLSPNGPALEVHSPGWVAPRPQQGGQGMDPV